ncbi:MAG: glutamine-hydrolyzing carbamoyl-phosphate synthase small subunit [Terriglobales bacterium]
MEALLALEDGRVFRGCAHGAVGSAVRSGAGEVVFNTSMTGYQEICTDPSYAGQIVCLTAPQIGNYGTVSEDDEASHPFVEGLIVREFSSVASNWRSERDCQAYLEHYGIPVLSDIDTRALVLHLRRQGVLRGVLATGAADVEALVARARAIPLMQGTDLAQVVSTHSPYDGPEPSPAAGGHAPLVLAYDFGMKRNILRQLAEHGCRVRVVPAKTTAQEALALHPDGIFLSNGPGDPEPCGYAVETIRNLMGRVPMFGICLGHQLIGLALGGKTYKLKFGHHGGNHPVKHEASGRVEITAHNHNFAVDPDSLPASDVECTHFDLNDGTLEGLRHRSLPLYSVQYHPEAAPGPHDSHYLFQDFVTLMCGQGTHA